MVKKKSAFKVRPVKYWHFELVASPTYQPKVSAFEELGMKLSYELSYKLDL